MNTPVQRRFTVILEEGLGEMADAYIAAVNERIAPAKLSLTALINAAVRRYIEAERADDKRAA